MANLFADRIRAELAGIEAAEGVTILYACESGSRAWGFESADSDYDVRFIYLRPTSWYLTIQKKRDVIERPIDDGLDCSGWDVPKALELSLPAYPAPVLLTPDKAQGFRFLAVKLPEYVPPALLARGKAGDLNVLAVSLPEYVPPSWYARLQLPPLKESK